MAVREGQAMTSRYPAKNGNATAGLSSLNALAAELSTQGLDAVILHGGLLTARNPAADPQTADVTVKRMNPELSRGMPQ
jgi:hypothetical protein